MKKIILSLVVTFTMFIMLPIVHAAEKVPVYMFTKNGCSACQVAFEYFDKLSRQEPDLFDLVELEVWSGEDANGWILGSEELYDLMVATIDHFDGDSEKLSTPTIFIGDYMTVGFPNDEQEVYDAIIKARDSEEKVDAVKDIAKDLNIDLDKYRKTETEDTHDNDALIIIGIFVVLVGGFVAFITLSRKNK